MSDVHPAATVLLLREDDGPAGFSVFMVRRSLSASFMPGAYVFPGGRVDAADRQGSVALPDDALLRRFSGALSLDDARAHLVAGARETLEEALIALPDPSYLRTWARWITPEAERKRFDAWFLVGRVPEGLEPGHDMAEVVASAWVDPKAAIEGYAESDLLLAPPTWHTLWDLSRWSSIDALLEEAATRVIQPVLPRFEEVDGAMAILLPGDPAYPSERPVDPEGPTRFVVGEGGRWWGIKG